MSHLAIGKINLISWNYKHLLQAFFQNYSEKIGVWCFSCYSYLAPFAG